MPIDLHEASVPVFAHYLARLRAMLDRAEAQARATGRPAQALLDARLAPDMLPLADQVAIAANFALRACFPLAGRELPAYGEFAPGFDGLRARIDRALALIGALPAADFAAAGERVIVDRAGAAQVALPGPAFLLRYALPNFFFHLTTAYALMRQGGVPLGKADFDGLHDYPGAAAARGTEDLP